jgi:hypothetical protein
MVQAIDPTAIGGGGGSMGATGILNSLAVKFDLYPNLQNQTGIYVATAAAEGMADDGTDIGFDIASGHRYHATVTFDANPNVDDPSDQLTLKIEDVTDPTVTPFETTFTTDHAGNPFDIATVLGSNCGYVGFTGATGGENAEQDILDWTFDGVAVPLPGSSGPVTPARVTQVFVNGQGITGQTTANGIAFRNLAGVDNTFGYPVPGPNQLKSIPWSNGINKVSLRFDQDVAGKLDQGDLVVRGINTANYAVSGFSYDAATKTGTWTLTTPITNDKVNLFLDDALVSGLDGEWTTAQAYPSGNGTAGGDFTFRLNVLRGDANQDGSVNALDLGQLKAKLNRTATNPGSGTTGYSVFADLNADGQINALDLGIAKARLNNRLPAGEPASLFSSLPISR